MHDESAVTIAFFREGVEFSDGIVECLLGKVAGTVWRVQDLVVEDGEVKSKTKANRVGRGEIGLSNIGSVLVEIVSNSVSGKKGLTSNYQTYLVSLVSSGSSDLALVARGELSEVAVIVALPIFISLDITWTIVKYCER